MKTTDKNFPMYKVIGLQLLLLIPSYLIVRFLLFRLHRSDDAPLIAAGVSAIGIFITYLTRKPFVFEGTIYGYLISFGISQIFKKEYIDPNHGNTMHNNWFEIWIITYAVIIAICVIMDAILIRNERNRI
ncbi:MAG: hypothetical protein IKE94_07320 [Aeriscardovia sp.]|nr:hypothetical protein [Aeriscardovia sp.]MBR2827082.1 hypothetical protein [Erysipelotrichaceae bacterium]MBR3350674.1 hypothetical protein [Erysipelotrichaceae bacterium]